MIIISALDNSGQLYAADLVRILRQRIPNQRIIGIGGKDLQNAGCELIHDISDNSAMLTGIIGALKWAFPAFRRLINLMKTEKIDLVILLDSPTFNLPLARQAKKRNIPTLYYIAPQVWAWAEYRVKKIRRRVDKLAVILPFEQDYFRDHGIDADFVGHPFLNHIKNSQTNFELTQKIQNSPLPRILLMPGSRRHVVHELLPAQLRVLDQTVRQTGPAFVTLAAWSGVLDTITDLVKSAGRKPILADNGTISDDPQAVHIFTRDRRTLIENASLVLAASGTGTLEVAWHGRPMIIMYNASKLAYQLIGRWLIKTKFLSLINILAKREMVPEFMPYIRDESQIVAKAVELLKNKELAYRTGSDMQALIQRLYRDDPGRQVADLAWTLITGGNTGT